MIFGYLASEMSTSALSQHVCFILVEPAHPGNIGSAARAIKTMGFRDLRVVSPWEENYRTHPEAIAYSTSSVDVLQSSRSYGSLLEALEGVHFAWAMSGYDREFGPAIEPVRAVAEKQSILLKRNRGMSLLFSVANEPVFPTSRWQCVKVAQPSQPILTAPV